MKVLKSIQAILLFSFILIFPLACDYKKEKGRDDELVDRESYLSKGREIANASFESLGSQVKQALSNGGVGHAIDYCNVKAMPLTDSLSNAHKVSIKRTSLKVRNPANSPTKAEEKQLLDYHSMKEKGEVLKPMARKIEYGRVQFYAPIIINEFCLQCHGVPGAEIAASDYEIIKSKYPKDAAYNYIDGDLRGMWSITFLKN